MLITLIELTPTAEMLSHWVFESHLQMLEFLVDKKIFKMFIMQTLLQHETSALRVSTIFTYLICHSFSTMPVFWKLFTILIELNHLKLFYYKETKFSQDPVKFCLSLMSAWLHSTVLSPAPWLYMPFTNCSKIVLFPEPVGEKFNYKNKLYSFIKISGSTDC